MASVVMYVGLHVLSNNSIGEIKKTMPCMHGYMPIHTCMEQYLVTYLEKGDLNFVLCTYPCVLCCLHVSF